MTDVPPPSTIQNVAAGNYATLNPLNNNNTLSNANLRAVTATNTNTVGTIAVSSGKWYYEATYTTIGGTYPFTGFAPSTFNAIGSTSSFVAGTSVWAGNGGFSNGDVCGMALDLDSLTWAVYKNGVNITGGSFSSGAPSAGLTWIPCISGVSSTLDVNFGQRPFSYTPPSGFLPLNSNNLPMPTIPNGAKVMAATTYTGTSSSNPISNATNNTLGTTFQPDFVWIKNRNYASGTNHVLIDSIRGASLGLASNLTNADFSTTGNFSSINNNGFTVAGTTRDYNFLNDTFVGWQWNAGSGTTSSGTGTGGITNVTQSVNVSAGFSIVKYTGSGSAGTVTHGLGAAPVLILNKSTNFAYNWHVYFSLLGTGDLEGLNNTNPYNSGSNWFNNSTTNSTTFPVGASQGTYNYVCYCWTPIAGYSAFGIYTGNGSVSGDGPFVYTGFRPRWVMIKATTNISGNWVIIDTSRLTYNQNGTALYANSANSEVTTVYIDTLSNGFKIRNNSTNLNNSASDTYLYACFAENPFKLALAR